MYNNMSNRYLTEDFQHAYPFNENGCFIAQQSLIKYYLKQGEALTIPFKLNAYYSQFNILLTLTTDAFEPITYQTQQMDDTGNVYLNIDTDLSSTLACGLYHCEIAVVVTQSNEQHKTILVPANKVLIQVI